MIFLDTKSHYSIKQVYGSPTSLVESCKTLGCIHVALTDYDSISGSVEFVKSCKDNNIKPILGCTFNTKEGRITVLAKNLDGWKALIKLVSLSYTKEFYDDVHEKPYISIEKLCEYSINLIGILGFPGDLVSNKLFEKPVYHLNREELKKEIVLDPVCTIRELYNRLKPYFGNLYLGLGINKSDYIEWTNEVVRDTGLPSVILTNSHHPNSDDYTYLKYLLCSKLKTTKTKFEKKCETDEPALLRFQENVWSLPKDFEGFSKEEVERTENVVNEIEEYNILSSPRLPEFKTPNNQTPHEYLTELARNGWKSKLVSCGKVNTEQAKTKYLERVKEELGVIQEAELSSYFLITNDFIEFVYKNGWITSPSRGCLSGDSMICSDNYYKPLSEIKIGDYVITSDNTENKVINTFKYQIDEEIINIKSFFGDYSGINLTKEHKCLSIKRDYWVSKKKKRQYKKVDLKPVWYKAEDLRIGDLLCHPKIKTIDKEIYLDLTKYCFSQKNGTKAFVQDDIIIYYKTGNQRRKSEYISCPKKIKLDKELAYVLGVFTGDGWLYSNTTNMNNVGFCFHSINNLESQNRVDKYMRSVGCFVSYTWGQNGKLVNQVKFTNGVIARLFRELFSSYNYKPDTKSVPEIIFECDREIITEYIMGLIASDGSVDINKVSICSISKKLVYQIKKLGLMIGVPVGIGSEMRTDIREEFKNRKRAYYARMPVFWERHKKCYHEDENFIYTPIRQISYNSTNKEVYDIEVENKHDYLTSCGIVHNSAGGCLVSYLVGITRIDPIEYNLSFSRFYNSSRKGSLPDIDTDVPQQHREEIIKYIREKYGKDKVGHLATYASMKGATAIKEVLRINDACSFEQMNEITKQIPEMSRVADEMENTGEDSLLLFTLKYRPDKLKDWVRYEEGNITGDFANFFKDAIKLEGSISGIGKHASAIVVFEEPLSNVCPMINDKSGDEPMVGYEMHAAESVGMCKLDLLGLSSTDKLMEVNNILKERSSYYKALKV